MERWKNIRGFKGYQVSDYGNVRSCIKLGQSGKRYYSDVWHLLKPQVGAGGYLNVNLCDEDGYKEKDTIHRLVAQAFLPNPLCKPFVCHKDDDPTNNYVGNLYWGTPKDNTRDAIEHGHLQNMWVRTSEVSSKPVYVINVDTGERKDYKRIGDLSKDFSITRELIRKRLKDGFWIRNNNTNDYWQIYYKENNNV